MLKYVLRLFSRFRWGRKGGCWEWTGTRTKYGYGQIAFCGRNQMAHRVMYVLFNGPVPEGHILHHVCNNPGCVNPRHLRPMTPREHCRKGNSPASRAAHRTACIRGHRYTEGSYYVSKDGARRCKECYRMHSHNKYLRRKARKAALTASKGN